MEKVHSRVRSMAAWPHDINKILFQVTSFILHTDPRAFVELLNTVLMESALPPAHSSAVLPLFLTTVTMVAEVGLALEELLFVAKLPWSSASALDIQIPA